MSGDFYSHTDRKYDEIIERLEALENESLLIKQLISPSETTLLIYPSVIDKEVKDYFLKSKNRFDQVIKKS